jgi:hypothetical protein
MAGASSCPAELPVCAAGSAPEPEAAGAEPGPRLEEERKVLTGMMLVVMLVVMSDSA